MKIMKKDTLNFTKIKRDEFEKFVSNYDQASFLQTVELANLKEELSDVPHFLGVKKDKKLVAATILLEEKSILGYKTFYAPRGFLIDYHDYDLLEFFTSELKKFVKNKKGFRITIDPNIVYRYRSSDGDILNDDKDRDDLTITNLEKLGYKHFGFNLYSETLQVRWEYRLKLDREYEELKTNFSKSTRKNIDACYKKGLRVRVGEEKDLESLSEIFDSTSKRKEFQGRSLSYYKKMYKHMGDLMTIYIAYLDPDIYISNTKELLKTEEDKNREILRKMEKDMVGSKLKNQKETSDNLVKKYKEELKIAEKFKVDNPKGKDIGALLSMKSGNEYLTLSSGGLEEYKKFAPKYALYNEHILDAIKYNYEWVDFYGITGVFEKGDKFYGIYEFKKGFNGQVVELVGQFEQKVGFMYNIYNFLKTVKKLIKK